MGTLAVFFLATVSFAVGVVLGYDASHYAVARDCERLGAFYEDNKVFECRLKAKVER